RYQISSGIIMGSISEYGFVKLKCNCLLDNIMLFLRKASFSNSSQTSSVFSGFSDSAQADPFRIHEGIRTFKLSWKFAA
ncbi:MAG: hypothetical protein VX080_11275, partial [SAR324 cluster bacterium]|nr:hypothetical protein [SAR324 cluster bacterium]